MVTKNIFFNQVKTLSDVLAIRHIRNECRLSLTNNTAFISLPQQIWWYFKYYRRASRSGIYRLYLARKCNKHPIGYGALRLHKGELFLTVCVLKKFRHQGYGQAILEKLIDIAKFERLTLRAEIKDTNTVSIAFHEKYKFKLHQTKLKSDVKLRIYKLRK